MLVGAPILYLLASLGNLVLAIVAILRARRARGAMPFVLLCLSLFLWDFGEFALRWFATDHWRHLRLVGSSLAPAFLFHFVLHHVGREGTFRRVLWLLYGVTALFGAMTAGAIFSTKLRSFVDDLSWNLVYLVALFPFFAFSFLLLVRRLRSVDDRTERNALHLIALGVAVGALTGLADLTVILGSPIPPLGHVGSFLCTVVLAVAVFRHRLLASDLPIRHVHLIAIVAAAAAILHVLLYSGGRSKTGDLLLLGTATLIVLVLAVYRLFLLRWQEQQDRQKRLAMLGTMAAGVAHEIRNPLASIRGAAQFVLKELESQPTTGESLDYLKMLVAETDRLNSVVESLLDFSRPRNPHFQPVEFRKWTAEIVALQRAAGGPAIDLEEGGPIHGAADPDLLRHAVGNVLKNAVEAAGPSGRVRVRLHEAPGARVRIEIVDDGPGLPTDRLSELVQPFVTTKTRGTGLGLAVAKRVVDSHGGELSAENLVPRGARFVLTLPLNGPLLESAHS